MYHKGWIKYFVIVIVIVIGFSSSKGSLEIHYHQGRDMPVQFNTIIMDGETVLGIH